jgi:hypothetical protein
MPPEFVEKDFWVTELLRAVVSEADGAGAVAVFKGGTSLSKGYRLIERFSEDVGILLVPRQDSGSKLATGYSSRFAARRRFTSASPRAMVTWSSPRPGSSAMYGSLTLRVSRQDHWLKEFSSRWVSAVALSRGQPCGSIRSRPSMR